MEEPDFDVIGPERRWLRIISNFDHPKHKHNNYQCIQDKFFSNQLYWVKPGFGIC